MKMNPDERMTIDEIFAHPWMQGEVTSQDEIIEDFNNRKKIVDDNAHNDDASAKELSERCIFRSKLISIRLKLCFLLKPRLLFDPLLVTS